ncbi:hypothetical protein PTSG_08605 [Salpingoeca rosetta]|uniref:DUF4476 domain-containing protein n=1 Tax=Salpingoeca rosetta (strain ATCC 50818 / BSB-021) TaxID=946362 RepID=F2UK58_SALR5|nr:uncharacterized protein PTSG_08605 [Salpingoeca rosetta]EGD77507.1 hypothetical protein PTSG_08605 [Salpingoeca rosetta]|eukprot:XP_004990395.1 hypothetical protein PTSG_08605 [Salpingoeca rosetta]
MSGTGLIAAINAATFESEKEAAIESYFRNNPHWIMTPQEFQLVFSQLSFDSTKQQAAGVIARTHPKLTCAHVAAALGACSHDSTKVAIAKLFAPGVIDKHNRATILSNFSFSSSKSEVNAALDAAPATAPPSMGKGMGMGTGMAPPPASTGPPGFSPFGQPPQRSPYPPQQHAPSYPPTSQGPYPPQQQQPGNPADMQQAMQGMGQAMGQAMGMMQGMMQGMGQMMQGMNQGMGQGHQASSGPYGQAPPPGPYGQAPPRGPYGP